MPKLAPIQQTANIPAKNAPSFCRRTLFYVSKRYAARKTVRLHGSVFCTEIVFGKAGSHTEKCGDPHPEYCTCTAKSNSASYCDNISCSYCCTECGGKGSERRNLLSVSLRLFCKECTLYYSREVQYLQASGSYCEDNSRTCK